MKKFSKTNKRGFTLVEMMLSLAIIVMMSSLFVGLMLAINNSFYVTYNTDDAVDYAAIYAQALENVVIRDVQNNYAEAEISYYIDYGAHCEFHRLVKSGTDTTLFELRQLSNGTDDKWKIYLKEFKPVTGSPDTYQYTFVIIDNYYHPGRLQMEYSGSFWVPHMQYGTISSTNDTGSVVVYGPNDTELYTFTPQKVVFKVS